jgi:hypothetical protein
MKRALTIGILFLAMVVGSGTWSSHNRRSHQQRCLLNMEMLYSAAVSSCLEQKLRPDELLSIEKLAAYVRPSDIVCPSGHVPYPAFSVLQGPTCPNGHQFEPGVKRPLRTSSSDRKVAGLYLSNGLTNLIDEAGGQIP